MAQQFTCGDCGRSGGSHTLQCPRFHRIADAVKARLRSDERQSSPKGGK